ncbi:hypothetical protein B0O99DRAFT_598524 [Bisporella sp. PMI_857]|nr:hypothetical protein B0O99DRAFT_598524 [Bisporella sp. PMI_857]
MPPANKRRKTTSEVEEAGPSAIIFASPALQPDVRLMIFDREIHCHSVLLKLHSAYFRKFLDSPDKAPASRAAIFRYDYVSVIDEDKTWALVAAAKAPPLTEEMSSRLTLKQKDSQFWLFEKLLCAIYTRPYRLNRSSELMELVDLADFYCALPAVSATIINAIIDSDMMKWEGDSIGHPKFDFGDSAHKILLYAAKLRNPVLFRECFIHTVGRWESIQNGGLDIDIRQKPEILRLVLIEYIECCKLIMQIDQYLMSMFWEQGNILRQSSLPHHDVQLHDLMNGDDYGMKNPGLYHQINKMLKQLLSSGLVLERTGFRTGEDDGPFRDYFLCAEIDDEAMPFPLDEVDW